MFKMLTPFLAEKLRNFPILHLFDYLIVGVINFQMCGLGVFVKSPGFVFEAIKMRSYGFETSHLHFEITEFFSETRY